MWAKVVDAVLLILSFIKQYFPASTPTEKIDKDKAALDEKAKKEQESGRPQW